MTPAPRVLVLICTGNGRHGRHKLGEWALDEQGRAYRAGEGDGARPLIDGVREAERWGALDVTCTRCPSRRYRAPLGDRGVRHLRRTVEQMSTMVRTALDENPERRRVVIDVSTRAGARLF